jgi:hypothetical protein
VRCTEATDVPGTRQRVLPGDPFTGSKRLFMTR